MQGDVPEDDPNSIIIPVYITTFSQVTAIALFATNLRRSIKVSARQQLKLLDSIGTSELERKLEKKVLEVTKSNADNLKQQSGIEPSLSMDEARQYHMKYEKK